MITNQVAFKVLIPPRYPGDKAMYVNAKQAHRILVQRQKRCKRMLEMLDSGINVVNPKLVGTRNTMSRKKDMVRSRVAAARKRVNGLFVNKKKEQRLENPDYDGNISDESDTVVPD